MDAILRTISTIRVQDIIDIAIISLIIYRILSFVRHTRAEQLLKGVGILLIVTALSDILQIYTVNWILSNTVTLGAFAIIVIFQPELRRGLEFLGRSSFFIKNGSNPGDRLIEPSIKSISNACKFLSERDIGALIVIEGSTGLTDIVETGILLNADISDELLMNIFMPNAPLHDGAVIIRAEKIIAAGTFLPLSDNTNISKEMGTRHRAGLGISEKSDCLSIMVSEETGTISIAEDGKLSRHLDIETLEDILKDRYKKEEEKSLLGRLRYWDES